MSPEDVTIVNTPTNETPQVLASGAVDAVAAWQPSSGQALKVVSGSKPIFTSNTTAPSVSISIPGPTGSWESSCDGFPPARCHPMARSSHAQRICFSVRTTK